MRGQRGFKLKKKKKSSELKLQADPTSDPDPVPDRPCVRRVPVSDQGGVGGCHWLRVKESLVGGAAVAFVGAKVSKAAPTGVAAVGRGPTVDSLVGVQVSQLLKAAAALRAGVRTLPCVDPLVSLQSRQDREAFPTLRAGEGALGTAVHQAMALEAGSVSEALTTLRTHEGFLPSVDPLVLPQVSQVVKVASTVPTRVPPIHLHLPPHRPCHFTSPTSCSSLNLSPSASPGLSAALWDRRDGRTGRLQGFSRVQMY